MIPYGLIQPLAVKCPKCGAKPGRDCNPHIDAKTGTPVYREPHKRRWDAAKAVLSNSGGEETKNR